MEKDYKNRPIGKYRKRIAELLTKLGYPCSPQDIQSWRPGYWQRSSGACSWSADTKFGEVLCGVPMRSIIKKLNNGGIVIVEYCGGDNWMFG